MRGPAVFIANDVNLDLQKLNEWGVVVVIFRTHLFPDTTSEMYTYAKIVKEKLQHFDPECDVIAMVGDPILTSLIVATLVGKGVKRFTLLKYDRKLNAYYPVTIDIGDKNGSGSGTEYTRHGAQSDCAI